jgi:hypothetical protein
MDAIVNSMLFYFLVELAVTAKINAFLDVFHNYCDIAFYSKHSIHEGIKKEKWGHSRN